MALIVISIDRNALPSHTDVQFSEWVKYCVGETGGISLKNPLADLDMEAAVKEIG